jgi:hypothetical protein
MAEEFLDARLPHDVATEGYARAAGIADYSSVEQMAMVYVTTYAQRMTPYLDAVSATKEFRTQVARSVARACILLARLQRSGTRFDGYATRALIEAAKRHGVNTNTNEISFAL